MSISKLKQYLVFLATLSLILAINQACGVKGPPAVPAAIDPSVSEADQEALYYRTHFSPSPEPEPSPSPVPIQPFKKVFRKRTS